MSQWAGDSKRPQSPLKLLKDTLKLKAHSNRPFKRHSIKEVELTSNSERKRYSAHKVTLFKHKHVRVLSYSVHAERRYSLESSIITKFSHGSGNSSRITDGSTVRSKPALLLSDGILELYQIVTPDTQVMNYLSLGRRGNIVHPILPKLQVTKQAELEFSVYFYNPERYWEIEFLFEDDMTELDTKSAVSHFEEVLRDICQLSTINNDFEDELDDLNHLLDNKPSLPVKNTESSRETINEAFKKAILNVTTPIRPQKNARRYSLHLKRNKANFDTREKRYTLSSLD